MNAVEHFSRFGCKVLNLDVRPPRDPSLANLWVQVDIMDGRELTKQFNAFRPDYLIHLAARTDLDEDDDIHGYAANTAGVENTIGAAHSVGTVRRAIFASSRMVCRIGYLPESESDYCPPNLYGQSKVLTEKIVRAEANGFRWIIVRPTSIWGPWFDIPYKGFFDAIRSGHYVHPRTHDPEKSFGYVGNTVYQFQRLLATEHPFILGKTLYQCDYPPVRLGDWAELIRSRMRAPRIRTMPLPALRIAAAVGDAVEAAGFRAPLSSFRLANLITPMVYPTALLEEICGTSPFSIERGVDLTVNWLETDRESTDLSTTSAGNVRRRSPRWRTIPRH